MVLCSDGVWDAISTEEVGHPQQPYGTDPESLTITLTLTLYALNLALTLAL